MINFLSNKLHSGSEVLKITQGKCVPLVPEGCRLLLGFWFGEQPCNYHNQQVAKLSLNPIGSLSIFEGWWYRGLVDYRDSCGVQIAECDDYTAAVTQRAEADPTAIKEMARETYIDLFKAMQASKHKSIIRIWNYFGDINFGVGDRERYRQFSIGRAEAFEEFGLEDDFLPPGTAIGTVSGNTFSVIALATNNPFQRIENPRQVSAYHYPKQYGPRSPKFSRGGVVSVSDHDLLLISGTAAIVGYESTYLHESELQTAETFRNIESLVANSQIDSTVKRPSTLRVYVRNREDYKPVSAVVEKFIGASDSQRIYLQGDICRKELLVEIDGVLMC